MVDALQALRAAISDRYRVEHLLGSGGMATVYLAHDLKHDRPVAIKVLRPELSAALGPERFLREIQIAAKLNHPHILTLHDSGEAGGLLYYVMPYVEGESVLERVAREKRLPIEDSVRIGREVASALAYARARGIIHRDIKPGNILLSNGYAMVADFGLARAISQAQSSSNITQGGLALGTPSYMSPEQSLGETELDGRSDIYSLGCVLYELLVGSPPFTASNPAAVLAKHGSARVPPIRGSRPEVPAGVERAVLKALEKAPADRFQRAEEMGAALGTAQGSKHGPLATWRRAGFATAIIGLIVVGTQLWRQSQSSPGGSTGARGTALAPVAVATSRYAVLPFESTIDASARIEIERQVQDALARWTGISTVDRFRISDALVQRGTGPLTSAEASRLAGKLGAGRLIRGDLSAVGDSIRVRVVLYEVATDSLLQEETAKIGTGPAAGPTVALLVDRLLLGKSTSARAPRGRIGTNSLPAELAYGRGQTAIDEWNLEGADSAFARALTLDPGYAQSALWLALVRAWTSSAYPRWRFATDQALAHQDRLSPFERQLATALRALSSGQPEEACPLMRRLTTEAASGDFVAWYSLATCLRQDDIVVRDHRSPSRWRFRSSVHEEIQAYRRAFEAHPAIHRAFVGGSYDRLRDLLLTRGNSLRAGRAAPPETTQFLAQPGWSGDSLLTIPYPAAQVMAALPGVIPSTLHEATVHQRDVFREIATTWAAAFPESSDALEALAIALEMLGDPSALDTLRHARHLARGAAQQVRIAATEVWFQLKRSLPNNLAGIRAARALADSLLRPGVAPTSEIPSLVALACLLGRASLAAALARRPGALGAINAPPAVASAGPALLAFATLGGPAESLATLEAQVDIGIRTSLLRQQQSSARMEWLARPATLAFPEHRFQSLTALAGQGDYLIDAQSAFVAGQLDRVRGLFPRLRQMRVGMEPDEIMFDALGPEARLLELLGDPAAAARWLDPTLSAIPNVATEALADLARAGAMVRAMVLRADLAARMGDSRQAQRWAAAVAVLWSGADGFLQPTVRRMRQLAG